LHHSSTHFANPSVFDPDHYLGVTKLAPELAASPDPELRDHYGYGSGRRLCPGIHLAERNLFLGIAKLLWAFDIKPGKDSDVDVDPVTAYSEGFLTCAHPYGCEVEVRSEGRKETILREFKRAEEEIFSKYESG
jgi:cytochrome P450